MSDEGRDLFGKIDALFEKRAQDALLDKGLEHEDFPVLTEIIGQAGQADQWDGMDRRGGDRRREDRRQGERRLGDRRQDSRRLGDRTGAPAGGPGRAEMPAGEVKRLMSAMEQRLAELFIRQQLRMEEAVRKVIREEMGHGNDE